MATRITGRQSRIGQIRGCRPFFLGGCSIFEKKRTSSRNKGVCGKGPRMLQNNEELSIGIAEVIRSYGVEQMGIRPKQISVDIHNHSVTVTLEGVSHPAEVNLSSERLSREMLEKMYIEMFNISKPVLYSRLEQIIGRRVERSFFAIESQFGNAVIVLFFSGVLELS